MKIARLRVFKMRSMRFELSWMGGVFRFWTRIWDFA